MKHISAFLGEFGLSQIEAESYELALGLGTFPASILANRLSIPRSTARYTCESLVHKGLMIETKKANTKLFIAENPSKLFVMVNAEEERLNRKKEQLATAVKELQQVYNPNAKVPKVTFYEGVDGVERMLDELMKSPTIKGSSVLYSFGAGDYLLGKEPDRVKKFRSKSVKKYATAMVMRPPKYQHLHAVSDPQKQNRYFQHIDELKVDIQITENTLTIMSLEDTSPIGVVIKHQDIVSAFRQIFMEIWMRNDTDMPV